MYFERGCFRLLSPKIRQIVLLLHKKSLSLPINSVCDKRNNRFMAIEVSFTGQIKSRKKLVDNITKLSKHSSFEIIIDDEGDISLTLCPTGEITFHVVEGGLLRKTKVEGYFQSTPAGPGFHKAAVDFIDALDLGSLVYEDDSEYANDRDFTKLCNNHFYRWLERLVELACQKMDEGNENPLFVCWQTNQYIPDVCGAKIVTPTSLWDIKFMNQLIHDRGIEAFADRFFVWPHEQQDATFYRNCAMKELWEDCYYVSSERSESDANLNRSIIDNLEKAYGLNPMLPIPYDNYCEVCHLDGRSPIIPSTAVSMNDGYKPGYRKGMVKETIDRLTIIIPGSYKRHLEFNDDDWPITIWCDESTDSPVWRLTIFELEKEIGKPKLEGNQYDYYEDFDIEGGYGVLALQQCQEDGDDFYMVICQIASGTSLHLITVSYKKQKEFDQIRSLLLLITCQKQEG